MSKFLRKLSLETVFAIFFSISNSDSLLFTHPTNNLWVTSIKPILKTLGILGKVEMWYCWECKVKPHIAGGGTCRHTSEFSVTSRIEPPLVMRMHILESTPGTRGALSQKGVSWNALERQCFWQRMKGGRVESTGGIFCHHTEHSGCCLVQPSELLAIFDLDDALPYWFCPHF